MKKISIAILSLLVVLFASCKKEAPKEANKQNTPQQLSISASVDLGSARSMDYKLINDEVRSTLEGKTKVSVYTCIYQDSKLLFNERLDWDVQPDKKSLKYDGTINLSASNPGSLTILAVIGDATNGSNVLKLGSAYKGGETIQFLSSLTTTTINVPYIMEAKLSHDGRSYGIPQGEQVSFKPYGHLLKVKMTNKTGKDVHVTGISCNRLLAKDATLEPRYKSLTREEYDRPINLKFPQEITIEKDKTASETFILWVPIIHNKTDYRRIDLIVKESDFAASRLYTTLEIPCSTLDYMNGKLYNAEIKLYTTAIPNPLSLLSDDVINKEGTDFVNLIQEDKFKIDDLSTYNGPTKVGYFMRDDAMGKFCNEKTYPSKGDTLWHLPDIFEWNSLLYNPESEPDKYDKQVKTVRVKIGVGTKSSEQGSHPYWRTVTYETYVPEEAKGTYIPEGFTKPHGTIKTGYSFYVLSFCKAEREEDDPDSNTKGKFPPEKTNYSRYAFRYELKDDRFVVTCVPVGIQEDIKLDQLGNHPIFKCRAATTRTIPFYGIALDTQNGGKNTQGGNRRIINYRTSTRTYITTPGGVNLDGGNFLAAFSAPRNVTITDNREYGCPVALFKKVTE